MASRARALTTAQLPSVHYGERATANKSVIDATWRATGCSKPTPAWGYQYWGMQRDAGAADMMIYCSHAAKCATPGCDKWARTCGPLTNATRGCVLQHPPLGPLNNTRVTAFWRSAQAHATQAGWADKLHDYTCDEPGSDATRIAACKEHGNALHAAVPELRSLITAERSPADASNLTAIIDTWVPIVNYLDANATICPKYHNWTYGNRRPDYDDQVAAGKELWSYQSCMSEGCAHTPPSGGCISSDTCVHGTWPST